MMKLFFTVRTPADAEYRPIRDGELILSPAAPIGTGTPEDPMRCTVTVTNPAQEPWVGVLSVELAVEKSAPQFFLPAFLYGRNRAEAPQNVPNEFPRLREAPCVRPSSPWWMMRGDRLSCPVAMVYDRGRVMGLSAPPYWVRVNGVKQPWRRGESSRRDFWQYAGWSVRLNSLAGAGLCSVGYTLGWENAPWHFVKSHQVEERAPLGDNCFVLEAGESVTVPLTLFDYHAAHPTGIYRAIRSIYAQVHETPRQVSTVAEAVEDLSGAVYRCAYLPKERMYSGFVRKDAAGKYTFNKIGSLTWTNGLSVAVPMLMAALRQGHEGMRAQALDCIDNIIQNCWSPRTGLPYDAVEDGVWSVRGWWFDGMHTAGHAGYLTGQAMYYLLRAYQYELELAGQCHDDWLEKLRPVLDHLERQKNGDGEYPFVLSEETGSGLEYDALGSSWCLAAGAWYALLTGDHRHLEGMLRSEAWYYHHYVQKAVCYGGPMDTDKAVDSEGILAYLRAVHALHRITGQDALLTHLRDGLDYEFSFKFAWESPVQIPPLSHGWSSVGGSVTSVANPHIHPMSSTVTDEIAYYVAQTGDDYARCRLEDTILWGCQTYNTYDGEYGYGEKGWMSERFCYSQGLLSEHYPDGSPASTWFALMPWAVGSVLEGLCGSLHPELTSE